MKTDEWIDRLIERHTSAMTRPEFLKAVRALSARYVEQRATLADRSPIDSAGKRAAFAAFYAPLHFLTAREIIRQLGAGGVASRTILDLGCGTGVAGAAWASECAQPPAIIGVDLNGWVIDEAKWNWDTLGLRGRTRRKNLVTALDETERSASTAIVLGWSLNELDAAARTRAIGLVLKLGAAGPRPCPVLVIEPIATRVVPWWDAFARLAAQVGARVDQWKFDVALPPALADLDEAAGFRRESLSARSVALSVC